MRGRRSYASSSKPLCSVPIFSPVVGSSSLAPCGVGASVGVVGRDQLPAEGAPGTSQSLSAGARDHKRKSLAHWVLLGTLYFGLSACAHAAEPVSDVVLIKRAPRCKEIGVVDGEGGGAESAIAEAKRRASETSATHMVLENPELDLDDDLTTVVRGTLFECPPPGSEFPPTGYP